ncbi:MAG: response regulator [Lentisphaeria bacterium]|nr:response regulator [Lentisphaeria bacterium]
MQYYFYSAISFIALVIHLIINWRQLFNRREINAFPLIWVFRRFLLCLLVFFISDILWGLLAAWNCPRLLYLDTVLFFLTMVLSVCAWTHCVVEYLELEGRPRKFLLGSRWVLLVFFIAALTVNFFTGHYFRIDARSGYMAGPLRPAAFLLLAVFKAYSSGFTLFKLLHSEGALRHRNTMVFAFGLTMLAAILLQLTDPFLPIYSIGCLIGCCLLHVFVIEEERDEMHRKEMLAHDYEAKLKAERTASQAKGLFFSSVSHDIRTPLNAIVGFSELLEEGISDAEERKRCISAIRSSGKVLARLVDDILDFSKLESGRLDIIEEPTDLPALVREVIAVCEVIRTRKALELKTEIGEMPWLSVDPQRIRQLLYNLLSNAYKYTMTGTITVRVFWQDGTLTLAVADTGKGISEEDLTRILQPFVQVADKNHRDGTGLGLPICQKLAALMDGELLVKSKLGVGSTFTVVLRNVKTAEPPAGHAEASALSEPSSPARLRILVVDDSPVNRTVLKAMLAKCGVTDIVMAENGRDALALLKDDHDFSLVFSDLWMPEMDGQEFIAAVRADAKLLHLPVYLITADVEARRQAETDGFNGILLKPVTLDKIRPLLG